MSDEQRIEQIKARCVRRQTEVLLVSGRGEIDFAPTFRPAEIDPDIPWLLSQLEASQRQVMVLQAEVERLRATLEKFANQNSRLSVYHYSLVQEALKGERP